MKIREVMKDLDYLKIKCVWQLTNVANDSEFFCIKNNAKYTVGA